MSGVTLTFDGPLARIRLERPDRLNAINAAMWRALPDLVREIEAVGDALVVLIEGADGNFSAGADIFEFDAVYADEASARDYLEAIQAGLAAIERLDRPSIALTDGATMGGGLALALCCDLRFASDNAQFSTPPARLGLTYGAVELRRLIALIGPSRAKEMLFSGRTLLADEALAIGLVDKVIARDELRAHAAAYANDLSKLSQFSIRAAKSAVEGVLSGADFRGLASQALALRAALGEDAREGRRAFAEKRAPKFAFRGSVAEIGSA